MKKITITNQFDQREIIGYLCLEKVIIDQIENLAKNNISPNFKIALLDGELIQIGLFYE